MNENQDQETLTVLCNYTFCYVIRMNELQDKTRQYRKKKNEYKKKKKKERKEQLQKLKKKNNRNQGETKLMSPRGSIQSMKVILSVIF